MTGGYKAQVELLSPRLQVAAFSPGFAIMKSIEKFSPLNLFINFSPSNFLFMELVEKTNVGIAIQ